MNARGATLTDADGHHLSDFCLGDTAAMFGHSPDAVVQALARQATRGLSAMLPEPGYWPAAQALMRRHGAALVFDETHTIWYGPGGYARAHGLQPDALVLAPSGTLAAGLRERIAHRRLPWCVTQLGA